MAPLGLLRRLRPKALSRVPRPLRQYYLQHTPLMHRPPSGCVGCSWPPSILPVHYQLPMPPATSGPPDTRRDCGPRLRLSCSPAKAHCWLTSPRSTGELHVDLKLLKLSVGLLCRCHSAPPHGYPGCSWQLKSHRLRQQGMPAVLRRCKSMWQPLLA